MNRFIHSHSFHGHFDECKAKFRLLQDGAPRRPGANNYGFGRTFHLFAKLYRDHCIERSRWSDVEVVGDLVGAAFRGTGLSTAHYEEVTLLARQFVANERIDIERSLHREAGIALDENLQHLPWHPDYEYDSPNFAHPFTHCACGDNTTCANCACNARDDECLYCDAPADHPRHKLYLRMQLDEVLVDASNHILIIDDWKTDYYVPSESDIAAPSGRWYKQAIEYAWGGANFLYPACIAVEVRFKFVRWNVTRSVTFYRDELDAYAETLTNRMRFIEETTAFPATPGEHCRRCPFLFGACPIAGELTHYRDEIEELAARYIYDEAEQAERRDALKAHAGQDGTIMVGGLPVAIFEKQERRILDVRKAIEAMRAEGIEGAEYLLDISPSKLKDKLDADQFERVMAAATERVENEVVFNVHQNKPELVALATSLGIPEPHKMRVAQLARAIAKATAQRAA